MISSGAISLSTIQMLYLSVGGLFLAAAALFHFSKKLPQAKDDSEFLKAPKAMNALLIMTVLLAACFYFIFEFSSIPDLLFSGPSSWRRDLIPIHSVECGFPSS